MRIFERLRGRNRSESGIERKPVEAMLAELLRRIDDQTPVMVVPGSKSTCCSCCSADDENQG